MYKRSSDRKSIPVSLSPEREGVELLPVTAEVFQTGAELLPEYESRNVFDALHVGHAATLDEPLVSTDTLYPRIDEVENVDPRDL